MLLEHSEMKMKCYNIKFQVLQYILEFIKKK